MRLKFCSAFPGFWLRCFFLPNYLRPLDILSFVTPALNDNQILWWVLFPSAAILCLGKALFLSLFFFFLAQILQMPQEKTQLQEITFPCYSSPLFGILAFIVLIPLVAL